MHTRTHTWMDTWMGCAQAWMARTTVAFHPAPQLDDSTVRFLRKYFKENNQKLFRLLGRDLGWNIV